MRIAYITMLWPVASETFAARDVKALIKRGNFIKVFALKPDFRNDVGELVESLDVKNIECERAGVFYILAGIYSCIMYPKLCLALLCFLLKKEKNKHYILKSIILFPSVLQTFRQINSGQFDIVHLFWGHYPSLLGFLFAKTKTIPFTMFLGPYDLRYDYALSEFAAQNAKIVFTHARENEIKIHSYNVPKCRIQTVYRGIDTSLMPNKQKIDNSFIFAGRVTKEKGIFETINAYHAISQKASGSTLTIIGDGPAMRETKQLIHALSIQNQVMFKGWLSPSAVLKEFQSHQYILFLSHVECLPNVLKEAMLMGIIPISSRTKAINEMIDNDIDGLIVDYMEAKEIIAEKVMNIMSDKLKRERLSKSARQKILERFNVDQSAQSYEEKWKAILPPSTGIEIKAND